MINLKDENATIQLGKIIADQIENGVIIALIGDLGSGKTTISKSIIKSLTNEENIPSPTFNIVNEYSLNGKLIYHFDFYRLEDENELYGIGFDDYLAQKNSIMLIEWADKFESLLPKNYIKLNFEKLENSRNVKITANGKKYTDLVENLISIAKKI